MFTRGHQKNISCISFARAMHTPIEAAKKPAPAAMGARRVM
jgi:hypothetical protein